MFVFTKVGLVKEILTIKTRKRQRQNYAWNSSVSQNLPCWGLWSYCCTHRKRSCCANHAHTLLSKPYWLSVYLIDRFGYAKSCFTTNHAHTLFKKSHWSSVYFDWQNMVITCSIVAVLIEPIAVEPGSCTSLNVIYVKVKQKTKLKALDTIGNFYSEYFLA